MRVKFCLLYSLGQTPVFQKDLTGKYLFAIILLELLIYLLDLGGLSLWIRKITYHEQTSRENTLKLRSVLQTLPDFTKDFFRAIEPNTSAKTRISYVYDIRLFFQFLQINNPVFAKKIQLKTFV